MTSKRARHVSSKGTVWHMSSDQATLAKMPKYNGYACGYGAHGNAKYHRYVLWGCGFNGRSSSY